MTRIDNTITKAITSFCTQCESFLVNLATRIKSLASQAIAQITNAQKNAPSLEQGKMKLIIWTLENVKLEENDLEFQSLARMFYDRDYSLESSYDHDYSWLGNLDKQERRTFREKLETFRENNTQKLQDTLFGWELDQLISELS